MALRSMKLWLHALTKNKSSQLAVMLHSKAFKNSKSSMQILQMVMGYRNNGKFFWNGKRIVGMNRDIDDYGSVPDAFEITGAADGFDGHTWIDAVDHNEYVPVNFGKEIGHEITTKYLGNKKHQYFVFTVYNVRWAICGHGQLVNGQGNLVASHESDAVYKKIQKKYNIPARQVLHFF